MSSNMIEARSLSKHFKLYRRARDRIIELLGPKRHITFTALKDITFSLAKGEALGIIGQNGSGKSTLLKLISGILVPDAGQIAQNGKITGLLELGTGFNPELSGRRNIYLNGAYMNLTREQLRKREEEIIAFAELGDFIDQPIKNYSSGMAMRLGFAIAIHADPQCFIIDEALSVGDIRFQQKCFAKLRQFRNNGGSILFVSHDLNAVRLLCDRAMLLNAGEIRFLGNPDDAVNHFNKLLSEQGESGDNTATGYGSGHIHFVSASIRNGRQQPSRAIISGQPMQVEFSWQCAAPEDNVTFGVMIRDRFGQDIFGTNGALLNATLNITCPGKGCFHFPAMNLAKGEYTISLSAHTGTTHLEKCFHWWDNAAAFEIQEDLNYRFSGIARLPATLTLEQYAQACPGNPQAKP